MPKKLHKQLEKTAKKKGLKGKRKDAYVFGTLAKADKKTKQSPKPKKQTTKKKK